MNLAEWRTRSPLLADLDDREFEVLSSIAKERKVAAHEIVFRVNTTANRFYVVTSGIIAIGITAASRPPVTIQTLGEGAILGLSWRLPPYQWQWTAQARQDSTLAEFDANEVLSACEQDSALDAAMWKVVAREASGRLQNVRMQLLDVYGKHET